MSERYCGIGVYEPEMDDVVACGRFLRDDQDVCAKHEEVRI